MRASLILACLLICGLAIAGCCTTSTRTNATLTPTIPPTVTTDPGAQVSVDTTSIPSLITVASTPIPTYATIVSTATHPSSDSGASSGSTGGAGTLRVSVLDVGQGDSILIQSPNGKAMLVDAGDTDAGSRVASALRSRGISSLDAAVASHAHADHIGGYQTVLSTFPVGVFYDSGYPATSNTYERLLTIIDQKNIRFITPTRGQTIDLDPSIRIDVLSPDGIGQGEEIHDNMLVLRLSYGTFSALLTGDMPDTLERDIAASLRPTTVLKVGHHGSRTSTSAAFLNAIRPEVAVISVGAGNSYNHPTAEVLQRLRSAGATTYRTDQSGTVTVSTDGNTYTVTTERGGGSAGVVPASTAITTPKETTHVAAVPVAPASSSSVAITALDLKGETVTITNSGSSPVSLSGWKLTDEGAKHTYTFGGTTLPPGGSITIASGDATGEIKWKSANVWNNDGDTAYLYNGSGALVSQKKG